MWHWAHFWIKIFLPASASAILFCNETLKPQTKENIRFAKLEKKEFQHFDWSINDIKPKYNLKYVLWILSAQKHKHSIQFYKELSHLSDLFLISSYSYFRNCYWYKPGFMSAFRQLWGSLVVQTVKRLPAMWETWVQSLGWKDPLEEGIATHSSILAWRITMDRGAWWATVHGVADSDMTEGT